jgi:hypothetical protein
MYQKECPWIPICALAVPQTDIFPRTAEIFSLVETWIFHPQKAEFYFLKFKLTAKSNGAPGRSDLS